MSDAVASLRVLMVDDDPSALFIYKTHLVRAGYQVFCVPSVSAAKQLLETEKTETFGAIVTDYWMPGATGFDLLRYVRQVDKTLSVIMITAEGEKEHVALSLREGAQNFLDKPVSGPVLREAAAKAVEATQRQRRLRATDDEAKALGDTQRLLLGRKTSALEGRLRLFSRPNGQAGGDFAAAYALDESHFFVMVSDVSGHDLKAAYYSAYLQGVAHGMLDRGASMEQVFRRMNALLIDEWNKGSKVELSLSACAAVIDLYRQSIHILNCGLPIPYLSDLEGWASTIGEAKASPLGWFDELPGVLNRKLDGGLLAFWSDGLEDTAQHMKVSPLALSYRVHTRKQDPEPLLAEHAQDDIVAVFIELSAKPDAPRCTRFPLLDETYSGAQAANIDEIQSYFERSILLAIPDLDLVVLGDIVLCYREALLNALRHGCQAKPDRFAILKVAFDSKANSLHILIQDDGNGHLFDFDTHETVAADQLIAEHRGLVLVKNLASRMHLSARGNRLTMDFPLSSAQPPNP